MLLVNSLPHSFVAFQGVFVLTKQVAPFVSLENVTAVSMPLSLLSHTALNTLDK